jgi:UDP-N-acetyl-2-amino-2-deoxyglucuronate dehydrogenase
MPSPLRCAIIGSGVIAPLHVESYQRLPNVEVTWACDLVESKAQQLAETYAIPHVTADYHDVLTAPDVDCVSICTTHVTHAPIAVDALHAGKHVLCEKPLASNAQGLDAMLAAHQQHPNLVFSGVFQHRFDHVYQYVRRLVQEGAFGTLLTANLQMQCLRTEDYYKSGDWRGTWDEEGGSLMINQAIHFVDSLSWVMGGVESLSAAFDNRTHQAVIETEDTVAVALRFNNGALGTIAATSSSYLHWEPTLTFHGTAGSLDIRNGKVVRVDFADGDLEQRIKHDLSKGDEAQVLSVGKSYYGPSHTSQLADFVDAIRDARAPFIPASQARHAVDIVLGIYRSQRNKGWVKV